MRKLARTIILGAATLAISASALAQQFHVEASKTRQLKLRGDAATVVLGDPTVADVSVHDKNLLFVTGRTFGSTNILIFDKDGKPLYSGDVVVTVNTTNFVAINRGGATNTYDCAPRCRSVTVLGDDAGYFGNVLNQKRQLQTLAERGN